MKTPGGTTETFYDVLGVDEKCSQDEIKKAYRKLSFMHHPDKNGNSQESTEKFQKISEAFSILSDPDERVKYDINRNNPFANIGGGGGGGGVRINPMDIFNMFMGGMGGIPGMPGMHAMPGMGGMGGMGEPHFINIGGMPGMGGQGGGPRIIIRTFGPNMGGEGFHENIMGGLNINDPFGMFRETINQNVNMSNSPYQEMHSEMHRTPRFNTKQEQKPPLICINSTITLEQACQGSTIPVEMERWSINSEGAYELEKHTEYISVPMGIDNGEMVILSNRGNEAGDRSRGDVKITFIIQEHPIFKRNGIDIILEKELKLKDALCGFVFDIEHVNGKKFAFNSSAGNIIRDGLIKTIPKLGIHRGEDCGNLNVVFKVIYPEKLTEEQIKILSDTLE
jgi:DnaJ-class molecular chaperone